MTKKYLVLLFGTSVLGSICFAAPAHAADTAFECPRTFTPSTPAKLQEVQQLLPEDNPLDDIDRLNATIDALQRDGLSRSDIINHLIGVYCPVVARNSSLSVAERTDLVRQFAAKITTLVSGYENEVKVIIDVPLKRGLVDTITAKAKGQGVSVGDWIARSVEAELSGNSGAKSK